MSVEVAVREDTLCVAEGTVHYVEAGTGETLVLVHGYADFSTWRVWEPNILDLASERRVIALDLPGYGESEFSSREKPLEFVEWFETYAVVLKDVIRGLELDSAAICGLSAGGCAAMLATTLWPELFTKLVLVDAAGAQEADRWRVITQPTLIVWQKEDELLPVEHGDILNAAIPNSRLEILEGNSAGIDPYQWHWAHALNPNRFNELVSTFLRDY